MTVFYDVKHPSEEKDTRAQQSLMETVNLILPLEATTVNNPSDSRSDSGVTAGATAVVSAAALLESAGATDSATIAQY